MKVQFLLLLLVPIHCIFAQEKVVLDTTIVSTVTNDNALLMYFQQLNPHAKKVKLNENELRSRLNNFFTKIYAERNARDSITRLLQLANQKIYIDSIATYSIYQRTDTLVFSDWKDYQFQAPQFHAKAIGIMYVSELIKFNTLNESVINTDVKKLNAYVEFLATSNISWSILQKVFVDKNIRDTKYNLVFLGIVTDKFYRLLKEKQLTRDDLIKLKGDYSEPIQRKFILEIMAKLNW